MPLITNCPVCQEDISEWLKEQIAYNRSKQAQEAGRARARSMTPEQRRELARKAGRASRRVSRKS